jgi:hypothetical protein
MCNRLVSHRGYAYAAAENQHPLDSNLAEQWEQATAAIQRLTPRHALIKRHNASVMQITTAHIPSYRATK